MGSDSLYTEIKNVNPLFPPLFWNVFDRIFSNVVRTTNSAEGWHRVINFRTQMFHPNIAHFLNEILGEEEKHNFDLCMCLIEKITISKNIKKEEKIRLIIENIDLFEPLSYLNALNDCFKCKFEFKSKNKE
ncbi:hypothetical protein DMUE_5590 [Dictyocoela muelleri]|nr:hypothetical protein DMUE_5590 [Dictyocoela muelleri]